MAPTTPKREDHVDVRPVRRARMDFRGEKLPPPIRKPGSSSDIHGIDAMARRTHTKEAIRAAMDHVIDRATSFDVDALETIYTRIFIRRW